MAFDKTHAVGVRENWIIERYIELRQKLVELRFLLADSHLKLLTLDCVVQQPQSLFARAVMHLQRSKEIVLVEPIRINRIAGPIADIPVEIRVSRFEPFRVLAERVGSRTGGSLESPIEASQH